MDALRQKCFLHVLPALLNGYCFSPPSLVLSIHDLGSRVNLALDRSGGTCTASHETTPCGRAIDGREDPETSSWIALEDNSTHWIHVRFPAMATVDTVQILQYCGQKEKLKKISLQFSDGNTQTVNAFCLTTKSRIFVAGWPDKGDSEH